MQNVPTCSCGQNEKKRIIIPCAGQANTGQVTNLAAIQLTEEGFGSIACVALLATGAKGLVESAKNADEVVIIDGCPVCCAKKIADEKCVPVGQHLIVTGLGIVKGSSKSYKDDDIETVVSACWEGKGRIAVTDTDENPKKNPGPENGCGCGCGGGC